MPARKGPKKVGKYSLELVSFEESLPKSATGKIQWRMLQEKELSK